jgi:hypothetical protein
MACEGATAVCYDGRGGARAHQVSAPSRMTRMMLAPSRSGELILAPGRYASSGSGGPAMGRAAVRHGHGRMVEATGCDGRYRQHFSGKTWMETPNISRQTVGEHAKRVVGRAGALGRTSAP